jgi:mono/diheme cytochrome c family protein
MSAEVSNTSRLRRWITGSAFCVTAILAAVGLAACDTQSGATTPRPDGAGSVPRSGDVLFARYCNTCHPGGGRGAGPSLLVADYSAAELKSVIRHGKSRMPGFGASTISDEELDALATYVVGLKP